RRRCLLSAVAAGDVAGAAQAGRLATVRSNALRKALRQRSGHHRSQLGYSVRRLRMSRRAGSARNPVAAPGPAAAWQRPFPPQSSVRHEGPRVMSTVSVYRPEDVAYRVDRESLIRELRQVLPEDSLIVDEAGRRAYECDGLSAYRALPLLVALPATVEQVQGVLRICSRLKVPVVARGSGTGLSGGALPHPQGVLLSLSKLDRILELDPERRLARVQPGVRNLAISEAAAPHGLYYAPDPSSQIACSIGGNVAENAGGVHCLKYGLTVHNVLKVEAQTIRAEAVTFGSDALDAPGFDMLALFHGSEGMLGVVTEVTVRLLPKPEVAKVLMASFDDVEKAGKAVGDIIAEGIIPAGLEMMDKLSIHAAEDFVKAGYPLDAEAILLCELDGVESDVD